jgi:hypothetical protein
VETQRAIFFNFHPMGLGGLWQNISWLLTQQKKPLEIILHLDSWNKKTFYSIFELFVASRWPVRFIEKDVADFDDCLAETWSETTSIIQENLQKKFGYQSSEIQTIPCTLKHNYWPVQLTQSSQKYDVALYLNYKSENPDQPRPKKYWINKSIESSVAESIMSHLDANGLSYVCLGAPQSIQQSVKDMASAKVVLGIEGGWTHVANSLKKTYFPIITKAEHIHTINACHGKEHQTLQPHFFVSDHQKCIDQITDIIKRGERLGT